MLSFPPSPSVRIFIPREAIDMRKGLDGLSGLEIDVLDEDPQSSAAGRACSAGVRSERRGGLRAPPSVQPTWPEAPPPGPPQPPGPRLACAWTAYPLAAADWALYQAKAAGRARIAIG